MSGQPRLTAGRLIRYAVQAAALGVAGVAVVLFLTGSPDTWQDLREVSWHLLWLPVLLVCGAWLCNGARIWLLARSLSHPLPYPRALAVALSTEFGIAASPAGMGGAVVKLALLKKSGIPITTTASMMACDLAADIAFFLLAAIVSFFVVWRDPMWQAALETLDWAWLKVALPTGLGVVVLLGVLLWNGNWVERLHGLSYRSAFGRKYRLAGRIRYLRWELKRSLRRMREVVRFLLRHRSWVLFANGGIAMLHWCCRYGVLPVIILIVGALRNPAPLMLIQGFVLALAILLIVPGGGGGVELLTPFVLQFFVPTSVIGVVILLWRACTYHLYLLVGGFTFVFTSSRLNLFGERDELSAAPTGLAHSTAEVCVDRVPDAEGS